MTDLIDKILKSSYSELFKNNTDEIARIYREYVKQVHPDVCKDPRADEAFKRLTELKQEALDAISCGAWFEKDTVYYSLTTGQKLRIRHLYHHVLDICEYFVCRTRVLYVFDEAYKKYFYNYKRIFDSWPHSVDDKVKDLFEIVLPQEIKYYTTTNNKYIISIKKPEDIYPLRAVVENYWKNKVPPKHLAWITSRLMHINTAINYMNYVVNGIDLDACFVNCKNHTISLYGGWWFATKVNTPMIGTTKAIFNIMPAKVKADKKSSTLTDIESVKLLLRSLAFDCPDAMTAFYNSGSKDDPLAEWKKWDTALIKAFGERKFIKIEPTEKEIYLKEMTL